MQSNTGRYYIIKKKCNANASFSDLLSHFYKKVYNGYDSCYNQLDTGIINSTLYVTKLNENI